MWKKVFSKVFKDVTAKDIWRVWIDVDNWPKWHADLEYCKLHGDFAVGNFFTLKPKNVRAVKIKIIDIDEGKSFTDCTIFFCAKMYDTHSMRKTAQGLEISNTL